MTNTAIPTTHPDSEKNVARMFDGIAKRYDFLNALLSAKQDARWRRKLASRLPTVEDGAMLDVATGTGDVAFTCMKAHPEYSRFVGVDISKNMLEIAREKSQQKKLSSLELKQMTAESLDFPAETFNALSISFGLRNVVDKEKALTEFLRVLKPGGTLLILEFFIPKTGLMSKVFQFYFKHILPHIGGLFSDKAAYKYLPESVNSFYTSNELHKSLSAKGGIVTKEINWLFGACRLVEATKTL